MVLPLPMMVLSVLLCPAIMTVAWFGPSVWAVDNLPLEIRQEVDCVCESSLTRTGMEIERLGTRDDCSPPVFWKAAD